MSLGCHALSFSSANLTGDFVVADDTPAVLRPIPQQPENLLF
jgi:hypothetical protein